MGALTRAMPAYPRNLHNSAVKILPHLKEFVKQKFFETFVFHKFPKSKHLTQSAPRVYTYLTFKARAGNSSQGTTRAG